MEFAREVGSVPGNVSRQTTSTSIVDAAVDFFAEKYDSFMRNRAYRNSVKVLSELDDHILRDIGVDRGAIMAAAWQTSRSIHVDRS
ncbi:MAG: DUF1127 domain-containing protein [Alphaproteobacteria bacterium]|jgi:uncharacterized protein YjiS (DUF1127 family)|nr:DUF1127 domain-containing protein [Alphaproteobacteria bacterium]MBT4966165.1 DUF1127 domain-containing protein [Alphaproteobacteria bacterium]MBT5158642.1 DUF1127 domain-containing protein [Alphaproteobacteria bacterium]MBT5918217.1 DUF1127 domain-containing protein [Alphaproteobacteria bacterium]MBT6388094.1 DUF1127 domain-containing protein [Alphaproteobacteria bacterium]